MALLAVKLFLAPAFVVLASIIVRRFGAQIGGTVGGLPVVAGPILLVLAIEHGGRFASRSARASLLGLLSLTAFVITYAQLCGRLTWPTTLLYGWLVFLLCTAGLDAVSVSPVIGLLLAVTAFLAALRIIPGARASAIPVSARPGWDLPVRAAIAAGMVLIVTAASHALGAHLSGLLAPFPIVTSVLAGFTHGQLGTDATRAVLRGMLLGFFGFAAFCATVAIALPAVSTAIGFLLAATVALAVQGSIAALEHA